jgi:hypothetical protein
MGRGKKTQNFASMQIFYNFFADDGYESLTPRNRQLNVKGRRHMANGTLHAHKACGNQFACRKYKIFVRAAGWGGGIVPVLIVFFLFPADDGYTLLCVYLYV